jgi:hypothetical protein
VLGVQLGFRQLVVYYALALYQRAGREGWNAGMAPLSAGASPSKELVIPVGFTRALNVPHKHSLHKFLPAKKISHAMLNEY